MYAVLQSMMCGYVQGSRPLVSSCLMQFFFVTFQDHVCMYVMFLMRMLEYTCHSACLVVTKA